MKLNEIAHDKNPCLPSLIWQAEVKVDEACGAIESGNWDKAYAIYEKLSQQNLPSEIMDVIRVFGKIVNPSNSPSETAKQLIQFFPGKMFRVYNDEHGWNDDAMRDLAEVQGDVSDPA